MIGSSTVLTDFTIQDYPLSMYYKVPTIEPIVTLTLLTPTVLHINHHHHHNRIFSYTFTNSLTYGFSEL